MLTPARCLGNLPKRIRDLPHAWRLLGYMPNRTDFLSMNVDQGNAKELNRQVRAVIEATMYARLSEAAHRGVLFTHSVRNVGDSEEYAVHLAAGIVDMQETWAMVGCWQRCPLCKVQDMADVSPVHDASGDAQVLFRSKEDKGTLVSACHHRAPGADARWSDAGYSYTPTSFWEHLPLVNPFEQLSLPDRLHCVHLGLAKKLIGLFPAVLGSMSLRSIKKQKLSNFVVHVIRNQRNACDSSTVPDSFHFVGEDGSVDDARMDGNHYKTILRRMPVALWVAMKTIKGVTQDSDNRGDVAILIGVIERYFKCIVALLEMDAALTYEFYDDARLGEVAQKVTHFQSECNTLAALLNQPNLWKRTVKFHIISHLPHYIRRFGPPRGFDTQVTEGNHKVCLGYGPPLKPKSKVTRPRIS